MYYDIDKKKEFDMVGPGTFIVAKTPNYTSKDLSHLIRPFFVVGRNEKKLYALYMTSIDKKRGNYFKVTNFTLDGDSFISNNDILEIDESHFIDLKYFPKKNEYCSIINELSKHIVDPNKVDYDFFKLKRKPGCIIYYKDNYYMYYKCCNYYYIVYPLKKTNNEDGIYINGEIYKIDRKKTEKIHTSNRLCIVRDNVVYKINSLSLKYGDVVIDTNGNKYIFISQKNDIVYACGLESLELFTGLIKFNVNNVVNKTGEIAYDDKLVLLNKLEKYLDNGIRFADKDENIDIVKIRKKLKG